MNSKFNVLSTDEKYRFFQRLVDKVRESEGNGEEYSFHTEDGRVNLIGVRGFKDGKACDSKNLAYDDTLFVVYMDGGEQHVESFVFSTEYGDEGTAYLALGQHKYKLSYHKIGLSNHLNLNGANAYQGNHKYRALRPFPTVRILRDSNRNQQADENESYEYNGTINIHYGGEYKPTNWSEGCQVVKGWENYKRLIRLIESDHSVKGTIDNELADAPETDGSQPAIYTLISGTFLEDILSRSSVLSLPIDLGGGRRVTNETIEAYYEHTEMEAPGGYFPVGANTVWHGGVHIYVASGKEVRSCLPGRIVAARLADTPEQALKYYGSRNFILVKHAHKAHEFYALYMHLNIIPLTADEPFISSLKWLGEARWYRFKKARNYRIVPTTQGNQPLGSFAPGDEVEWIEDVESSPWKKLRLGNGTEVYASIRPDVADSVMKCKPDEDLLSQFQSGDLVKLDIEVGGDEPLWQSGEYGPKDYRKGLIHWEIFSQENLFPPSNEDPSQGQEDESSAAPGDEEDEGEATRAVLVREVTGPADGYPSQTVTYRATKFNVSDPTPAEKKKTNWVVKIDGSDVVRRVKQGESFTFEIKEEWKGKTLQVMPYLNSESAQYCVQTKIALNKPLRWQEIEDTDNDFNMDGEAIMTLFETSEEERIWDTDQILTAQELQRFYSESPNAQKLRTYACKFVSEWGIQDIDSAIEQLKGGWRTNGLKEALQPYQWWQEAANAGCELPDSPMCWHYNPIAVLEVLSGSTTPANTSAALTEPAGALPTRLSESGINLLKSIEALRLEPYDDQTGRTITSWVEGATIGYGHLISEDEWEFLNSAITEEQAEQIFKNDLEPFEDKVSEKITVSIQQQQFDAMVILAFNIGRTAFGNSSVVKLVNDPGAETPYATLETAWKAWNKSQGVVSQGLINRRNSEWKIYTEGVYETW